MADVNDNTKNFIDQLSQGKNDEAGEAFKAALRDKVANSLDNARKDLASNMFKVPTEAEDFSDPKPEIAGTGTFTQDGQVEPTGANAQETQPETPEVSDAESQPASTEQPSV